MSRMSRNKGKRGERDAAKELNRLFGLKTRRAQQYCGEAGDADLLGVDGLHVEVKRTERFHMHPALEQADSDRKAGETPLVLTRQNLKSWVFCCYLEDLPKVMERLAPSGESEEPASDSLPLDLDPKSL
jgi:Holliday junction resolvase